MGFWEKNYRDKVPFSSHNIKGFYYQRDLSLLMLTFDQLAEVLFETFHTVKLLFLPLFYAVYLEDRHHEQPSLMECGVMCHFFEDGVSIQII